ncbi:MAG TPA: dienelactone hydrolase family protein [Acidimicrobiia bacterium]|nr:dienelactone hydrolase family protein [Acidimicrobiia bacterium]
MLDFIPVPPDFEELGLFDVEIQHSVLSSGTPVTVAIPETSLGFGLVFHPDINGLRPLVEETIAKLAGLGITTIAIEPFSRMSDNPSELTLEEKFARIKDLDDNAQCADLLAAGQILRTQHNCMFVSMMGFCIGGMYAFKCAGTGEFDDVISCYGMITLPQDWKGPGQREPLDYVAMETSSPVIAIVGGQDHYAPSDDVEKLSEILNNKHHKEILSELIVFPDADHAFMHDPDRDTFRADDAKSAWALALDVVKQIY